MVKRTGLQIVLWMLLSLFSAAPVLAQSTSAAIAGRVTDAQNNPVAGATVEVVHGPSGSKKTLVTDESGRYSSRGMRVGGPYTVTATASGMEPTSKSNISLLLDQTVTVNLAVADSAASLEAVEVIASASDTVFSVDNMGSRTNITREQIENFPSIRRSIEDYVRFDPRVVQIDKQRGGLSAGGQNNRYNNIRVDGVPTNDQFGLNDSGQPALNQPIGIDWIEEFNVGISTYDVTQSDFVGANINAVTKSGGNDFSGGVYGTYRNNDMIGEDENGNEFTGFDHEWTAGAYVGGPIIDDILYFFVGYEHFERSAPLPSFGIQGSGATNIINITQAQLDDVVSIARGYGFAPGSVNVGDIANSDDKYFAKLDWNINENHRAWFRYNQTEGSVLRTPNLTPTLYSLTDHWFEDNIAFESYAAGLYSSWTDIFSSEFNVSYSQYDSDPNLFSIAPQVTVTTSGANRVNFGTEQFRQANVLGVDTWTAFWAGDLFLGDHSVRFGLDYEQNDFFNLFLESSLGRYAFNSIDDFRAGRYATYVLRTSASGDINDAAADWAYQNYGWFVQDSWTVNPNLTVLYGFRVDISQVDDVPALNPLFASVYGFPNNATVDDNQLVQPRFGFNYTFDTERRTQLRGGFGLFQGSPPGVWLSNNFTNTGTLIRVLQDLNGGTGISADPSVIPAEAAGATPAQDVDTLDPNFKQPSAWKWNLAFEHELPWMGLVAGAEYLVSETKYGVFYDHLNLGAPTGRLPDGRNGYWSNTTPANFTSAGPNTRNVRQRAGADARFNDVMFLRNTESGEAENITLSLEKPFEDNWYAKLAYTYGDATDANPGTSSRAITNWNSRLIVNPNDEFEATSNYEIRNRWTGLFSYRAHFFENAPTTFSLFYEGRSGRPYSYAFLGDANGDRINANDLFYIPVDGSDVLFTSASTPAQISAFLDYIQNSDYLNDHRGEISERNAKRAPWVNQVDLRVSQEVPFFADTKGEIYLDILNVGNLINDEWGQIDQAPFPYRLEVARFAGVDPATGRYIYDVTNFANGAPRLERQDLEAQSRWAVQVGFRYEF